MFETLQSELPIAHKAELKTQYRMRRGIGDLISFCFYDGKLKSGTNVDARAFPDLSWAGLKDPITWIDTDPENKWVATEERLKPSFINVHEVDCVIELLLRIVFVAKNGNKTLTDYTIGIITGYAAQVRELNREIKKQSELDILNIDCDTVHAFQGREVDICIYSVTRNNKKGQIGFLQDWRHLNVALSRARDYLVIVGGFNFCETNGSENPFKMLTDYIADDPASAIVEWNRE